MAAREGRKAAVKVLLRAKADPMLAQLCPEKAHIPLDVAAESGHS